MLFSLSIIQLKLLKTIKLLNLTETTGTYLVRGSGHIIFKRAYQNFPDIPVGQYAPGPGYGYCNLPLVYWAMGTLLSLRQ
jgi:hypothetical protein